MFHATSNLSSPIFDPAENTVKLLPFLVSIKVQVRALALHFLLYNFQGPQFLVFLLDC